ncbi:OmpA family protein [Zeaxanthinibacter enoshimensis]|uniref:WD40 repeat protein n=1 Tax=Zeaxanthinibacter enoshimensis TaxID=392009 RepID=A0A4R6TME1_9FLAO|nr:OmpA family protein [Zeaxanthinibacter enoshimensis]TDQ30825.1 WD40 repeat protein [Zeaxanthinibacter enoshimensis]
MTKKSLLLCILAALLALPVVAQERLINKGNEKYQDYSFTPAIDIYQRVLDKGYVSADLLKKLGNAYYFNSDYDKAAEVYKRLVSEYPDDLTPDYFFRYSQSLKSIAKYEESNKVMQQFVAMTGHDERASRFSSEADYLEDIEKNSGRYTLKPFAYNSPYSDFAPSYYRDGLIFSSDRDTGNLARYRHTWTAKDFLDLYKVNADSVSLEKVVKVENVNSRWHESTTAVTPDGNTLYFTRNNEKDGKLVKGKNGIVRLKIYRATKAEGEWLIIEDLPINSDAYSVANPALSPDGKYLYFASDMPGTLGESDIFRAKINDDGTFGSPENLGPVINTEARETFPYITENEILYFSSDGHLGLGGLDVFAAKILRDDFEGPVKNVGRPVNSPKDDFTFVFREDKKEGYFASNREGGMGADDIYAFVENEPLQFECIQQITGTVRDKISNELLVGANVKVIDESNQEIQSSITGDEGTYALTCDCNKGNFVRAVMQGYIPAEEYLGASDGKPRIIDFYLERETVTGGYGDDLAKLLQLSTIYFDFDKYNIRPDAEVEIQKVIAAMEKYPSLKLKVNSHTDSRGPDAYNLWLSQKRAESTVNYMVAKGISADRLQFEGYGETKLVNQCSNGVKCTQEEHELNRRSEFIILE